MPFDGNGNWSSNFSAQADRDAGYKILASRFDNIFIADLTNAFNNCVTRDGQGVMQTNTNANNYRVINVADPVSDKDAVNYQTLTSGDLTFSGNIDFSGNLTAETQDSSDSSTKVATTAFVKNVLETAETKGAILALFAPDMSTATAIYSGYVTTEPGWILFTSASNYSDQWLAVDGVEICRNAGAPGSWVDSTSAQIFVGVGQTITFVGSSCRFVKCAGLDNE